MTSIGVCLLLVFAICGAQEAQDSSVANPTSDLDQFNIVLKNAHLAGTAATFHSTDVNTNVLSLQRGLAIRDKILGIVQNSRVGQAISRVDDFFDGLLSRVTLFPRLRQALESVRNQITNSLTPFDILPSIGELIASIGNLYEATREVLNRETGIRATVGEEVENLREDVKQTVANLRLELQNVLQEVRNTLKVMEEEVKESITVSLEVRQNILNIIRDIFTEINRVDEDFNALVDSIQDTVTQIKSSVEALGIKAFNVSSRVTDLLQQLMEDTVVIHGDLLRIYEVIMNPAKALQRISEAIQEGLQAIRDIVSGIGSIGIGKRSVADNLQTILFGGNVDADDSIDVVELLEENMAPSIERVHNVVLQLNTTLEHETESLAQVLDNLHVQDEKPRAALSKLQNSEESLRHLLRQLYVPTNGTIKASLINDLDGILTTLENNASKFRLVQLIESIQNRINDRITQLQNAFNNIRSEIENVLTNLESILGNLQLREKTPREKIRDKIQNIFGRGKK